MDRLAVIVSRIASANETWWRPAFQRRGARFIELPAVDTDVRWLDAAIMTRCPLCDAVLIDVYSFDMLRQAGRLLRGLKRLHLKRRGPPLLVLGNTRKTITCANGYYDWTRHLLLADIQLADLLLVYTVTPMQVCPPSLASRMAFVPQYNWKRPSSAELTQLRTIRRNAILSSHAPIGRYIFAGGVSRDWQLLLRAVAATANLSVRIYTGSAAVPRLARICTRHTRCARFGPVTQDEYIRAMDGAALVCIPLAKAQLEKKPTLGLTTVSEALQRAKAIALSSPLASLAPDPRSQRLSPEAHLAINSTQSSSLSLLFLSNASALASADQHNESQRLLERSPHRFYLTPNVSGFLLPPDNVGQWQALLRAIETATAAELNILEEQAFAVANRTVTKDAILAAIERGLETARSLTSAAVAHERIMSFTPKNINS